MTHQTYPWDSPAVLTWLFPGDNLGEEDFDASWIDSPPDDNPQNWSTFREAVVFASTSDGYHGKGAWITVGDEIFDPVSVHEAYKELTS